MKIEKFLPSAILMPFVREFIIIESHPDWNSKPLPDTAMVMTFRYRGNISMMEGEKRGTLPTMAIAGLRMSARHFFYAKETANLLILFNEGGVNAFSRMPAHELFGQHVPSENLFPASQLNEIRERLAAAVTNRDRISIIETFLMTNLSSDKTDLLVGKAIQLIKQHSGLIRIKHLATSLHISQDAFEKRFRTLVGSTPKQYASIIRLRTLIKKIPSYPSLTDATYEAGYFDQSHFIKDFRLFTGQTPKDFFKSSQYW